MFSQLWPLDKAVLDADLPGGTHNFSLKVGQFDRATYGYSLTTAPVSAEAAVFTITRVFHPKPGPNDFHPMPASGVLANPGAAVLNSSAAMALVAYQTIEFEIVASEVLPGFRLYADLRKRSALR